MKSRASSSTRTTDRVSRRFRISRSEGSAISCCRRQRRTSAYKACTRRSHRRWRRRSPSSCAIRTSSWSAQQMPGRHALPQHHRPPGRHSPCGCNPITRPTIRAASRRAILDGLMYGCGDAVIGINPATDSVASASLICRMLDRDLIQRFAIPTQSCVLTHVTTARADRRGAPVDLVFQSIAGTEAANRSFGVTSIAARRRAGGAVA